MVGQDLVVFVALSCQEHHISRACFINRHRDGFAAVRLDHVFAAGLLHADDDVADDLERIFLARIVAGENREIAEAAGKFAHDGALGAVARTAAAKERDDSALGIKLAGSADQVFKRVVGVRIIHHDQKGLSLIHALEAARNGFQIAYARLDDFVGKTKRDARAHGGDML